MSALRSDSEASAAKRVMACSSAVIGCGLGKMFSLGRVTGLFVCPSTSWSLCRIGCDDPELWTTCGADSVTTRPTECSAEGVVEGPRDVEAIWLGGCA